MKLIKTFAVLLAAFFMIAACQKEYSVETGSVGGLAVGTLKDFLGDCQPITLRGLYFVDSTLTDSNYVMVQVNITVPGSYKIFTDIQNGYSFKDSGYFATPGLISVRLKASGRPILPITSDFTVTFGTSYCLFSVPVLPKSSSTPAVYTLSGTPSNCTNAVVQGAYNAGTALNSSNRVTIEVNVTTAGTYVITTPQTNGMTFLANGAFASTGVQSIVLQGVGTPNNAGATAVPVSAGGTSCAFTVNVVQGNINQADSAWQFTQGTKVFHGTLDSIAFSRPTGSPFFVLQLIGYSYATGDSAIVLAIAMPGNTIQSGNYNTSTLAGFAFQDITTNPNKVIYEANPLITAPVVNIDFVLNYDATTKIAQGTFTGTAKNAAGASVPITIGKFKAVVP